MNDTSLIIIDFKSIRKSFKQFTKAIVKVARRLRRIRLEEKLCRMGYPLWLAHTISWTVPHWWLPELGEWEVGAIGGDSDE